MQKLVESIKAALDALCQEPGERDWGTAGWTRKVKSALAKLAANAGHCAYASNADHVAGDKEWLYDLVWLDYSPAERHLKRTIVVLESEWAMARSEIDYDFQKLLVAKADLRLMVFQVRDSAAFAKTIAHLVAQVRDYDQSQMGDRHLFSGWLADSRTFEHHLYVHKTKSA